MLLSNRVSIITGGARGIGRGIALRFAEEGCSIVIADIIAAEAMKTVEDISKKGRDGIFVPCDVSDGRQVENMVRQVIDKYGKVDILVNNAGIVPRSQSIINLSEEEWDRVLSINLKGVFLCCKAVVPHMKEKRYGKIINISSLAAISPPAPMVHYCASKAGIVALTTDLAIELASFNICANAILPGIIRTEMMDQRLPPNINIDDFYAMLGKSVPMQRVGTPEDVSGTALFLASDLSGYITADRVIIGGGIPWQYLKR